jgi:hypothetical protein
MKIKKDTPCKECGGMPKLFGSDYLNTEGPWNVACSKCGKESIPWAYPNEAWKQWNIDNKDLKQVK